MPKNMSYRPRRRHIIIVKGIRLADLIAPVERQTSYDDDDEDAVTFYEECPKTWMVGDELPPVSLKCWNCDCSFTGAAAFIPESPHKMCVNEETKVAFGRFGVYCSWPCAARDAYHRFGGHKEYSSVVHNLAEVYYMVTGVSVPRVKLAPEKTVMAEYHGNGGLSRSEYREALRSIINEMESC